MSDGNFEVRLVDGKSHFIIENDTVMVSSETMSEIAYVIEWVKEKLLAMFKWVYDIFVKLEDMIQTIIGETALGILNALL